MIGNWSFEVNQDFSFFLDFQSGLASCFFNTNEYPFSGSCCDIGARWYQGLESPILQGPLAVIKNEVECNYLLNPLHPDFNGISIKSITSYAFDHRLISWKRTGRDSRFRENDKGPGFAMLLPYPDLVIPWNPDFSWVAFWISMQCRQELLEKWIHFIWRRSKGTTVCRMKRASTMLPEF